MNINLWLFTMVAAAVISASLAIITGIPMVDKQLEKERLSQKQSKPELSN